MNEEHGHKRRRILLGAGISAISVTGQPGRLDIGTLVSYTVLHNTTHRSKLGLRHWDVVEDVEAQASTYTYVPFRGSVQSDVSVFLMQFDGS